ncbi:F17a-G fimbrial adhesin [Paraburkholderia nemoris]|nr:F17a-G fimbrial adhesin [Paraburkholderia nemoris]
MYIYDEANNPILAPFIRPINGTVASATCTVTTPSIAVSLGAIPLSQFTGVGATSQPSQSFNIQLQCSGQVPAQMILYTLTDQTDPTNVGPWLNLTPGSTAQDLGIQVQTSGGYLVGYGPDSSVVNNTNQQFGSWVQAGGGMVTIPLTARYIQTGSSVRAGSANGQATFTMSYQ